MMHFVSYQSPSIQWMQLWDNFTTDISDWLQVANMKAVYWSSKKVNYIEHILKYHDQYTSLNAVEDTL